MEARERSVLKRSKEYMNRLINKENERLDRVRVANGEVRRHSKENLEAVIRLESGKA